MAELVQTRTAGYGTVTDSSGVSGTGTLGTNAWLQGLLNDNDAFIQKTIAGIVEGRITLTAGTPVTTSDVTAATTIRLTPYGGFRIGLYDGSRWRLYSFTEVTLALGADAANTPYDLFAYDSGGTVTLERLAWTNDTTRATALTTQDGVLVKTGATTRRYLGTYRTTGTVGQTEDSVTKRYVWNYYNRVRRPLFRKETTGTWNYTTATWRQANAAAANQVEVIVGWAEALLELHVVGGASNTNAGVAGSVGIGEDSTTTPLTTGLVGGDFFSQVANVIVYAQGLLRKYPAVGKHTYAWLEISTATGTMTWIGNGFGFAGCNGLNGTIEG